MKKILTIFLLIVLGLACQKDEAAPTVYEIEPKLEAYLKTFIAEGQKRGVDIPLENLILKFTQNITDPKICGQCIQTVKKPKKQRTAEINNLSKACWQDLNSQQREALVFHELGHCLLGRINHENAILNDGSPKSIMTAGYYDLYIPCIYAIDNDPVICNKTNRRDYYLDELFEVVNAKPNWL